MIKNIAYNILAACGSLALALLIAAIHVHVRPVGSWSLWPWIIFTYALFYSANRRILSGKSLLFPVVTILATLWIILTMYSGRLINAVVGGH